MSSANDGARPHASDPGGNHSGQNLAQDGSQACEPVVVEDKSGLQTQAREVLQHLNDRAGRSYEPMANLSLIVARLKDGASVEKCRAVIDLQVAEWGRPPKPGEKDMRKYLRPKTLFNATNFAQYAGALGSASNNGYAPGRTQSDLTSRAQAFLREQEASR